LLSRDCLPDATRRNNRHCGGRHPGNDVDEIMAPIERRRRQHRAIRQQSDRTHPADCPQRPGIEHRRRGVKARKGHDAAKAEQIEMPQQACAGRRQITQLIEIGAGTDVLERAGIEADLLINADRRYQRRK